jgi:hypothetical protein
MDGEITITAFIKQFWACYWDVDKSQIYESRLYWDCDYWMAHILCSRFPSGIIVYAPESDHFLMSEGAKLYDITGEVSDEYVGQELLCEDLAFRDDELVLRKVLMLDTLPAELDKKAAELHQNVKNRVK